MPRVRKTKSNAEPITVIPETQLSQQDFPPTAGELTTANADAEFALPPPNKDTSHYAKVGLEWYHYWAKLP